ncbi:MAG: flagellar protein FliT [Rhodocyclaceae bacterium]|nr:flagellar protein FliT [Rhodocyclaceae bacterium]
MPGSDLLHRFEDMATVSRRMVEAAQANAWDELLSLNDDLVRQREAIAALPPTGAAQLPIPQQARIGTLIREMQGHDHRIREVVGPMRDSLRDLLARKDRSLDLDRTYGAFRQSR